MRHKAHRHGEPYIVAPIPPQILFLPQLLAFLAALPVRAGTCCYCTSVKSEVKSRNLTRN